MKFSYYDVYRLLFNKEAYIDINNDNSTNNYKYTHYNLRKQNRNDTSSLSFGSAFENSLLKADIISLNVFSDIDLKIISLICDEIFNPTSRINNTDRNSLTYGHNYYHYFEDEISESEISNAEFNHFMEVSYRKKKDIVDKAYVEDRLFGFLLFIYKIEIYKDIKSKTDYEDFIRILFYIGSLESRSEYLNYHGIDFKFLENNISNYRNILIKKSWYKDESEIRAFFRSLFYKAKNFYYFETSFIKYVYDEHATRSDSNIPFSKHEIEDYLIYCFENDSKSIKGIDKNFRHCYNLCFIRDWQQESLSSWKPVEKTIKKNKEDLLYKIIPKVYKEFLVYCVTAQDLYGTDNDSLKVGLSNDYPIKIFGSYDNLIQYLESDDFRDKIESPFEFLDEFLVFAREVNATKKYVYFEFKYPPVLNKLNALKRNHL
ncbi:hypothetical protein AS361_00730 [Myroides marinus]|uniref:hypothetical protein n=1 Tax=Myroides marinus TaxID=703342 RepID=UPI0007424694|nr:hypothetical protein [Myroides marinus]KUF40871.1 hypothetical protein AS361_00730 [Myroides marinus]